MARRLGRIALVAIALLIAASAVPWAVRSWWEARASNPVRRGLERAEALGCFACHGAAGADGLPDPGIVGRRVPAWTTDPGAVPEGAPPPSPGELRRTVDDIRRTIRFGRDAGAEGLGMPAYEERLRGDDLDDLTAAVVVLAGAWAPPEGSAARRGRAVARRWGCTGCHNAGGAGGLPNPGSWSGFVPGWYGPDFEDLVRSREEFDGWIRDGGIPRLAEHPIASRILGRQTLTMPAYPQIGARGRDDLWAYVEWLGETGGGVRPAASDGPGSVLQPDPAQP